MPAEPPDDAPARRAAAGRHPWRDPWSAGPLPGEPPARHRVPLVSSTLISLCTVLFLASPAAGLLSRYPAGQGRACAEAGYFAHWGVIPAALLHRGSGAEVFWPLDCPAPGGPALSPALTVLTSLFVHAGWLHLLGNMLFLLVFGPQVEERLGRAGFALFYLAAGYLAAYGYALGQPDSAQALVGASGAIAGVLGAYLVLYPRGRVTSVFPFLLFLPLRLPAWLVLGFWFALQWFAVRAADGPGVAYLAHVVGFLSGALYAAVFVRRRSKLGQPATRGGSQP